MADTDQPDHEIQIEGNMFLYQQPELLTREEHGHLGISPLERPFEHVKAVKAIPLALAEFGTAQKHYPIIFSDLENAVPLAVVGVVEEKNLFVDDNGHWDQLSYVPFYIRCHPFAFTSAQDGQVAVVIDRAAPQITENSVQPFFDGENVSAATDAHMKMCGQYQAERRRTQEFSKKVADLGLLRPQRAMHRLKPDEDEQPVASYVAIDSQKLAEVDKDTLQELHLSGELVAMYNQLNSLENWQSLLMRRQLVAGG